MPNTTKDMPTQKKDPWVYRLESRRSISQKTNRTKTSHTQDSKNPELHTHKKEKKKRHTTETGAFRHHKQHTGKCQARNLGEETIKLQKSPDPNDMRPIWGFRSKLRMAKSTNQIAIKKQDRTECQGMEETLQRWEEWAKECSSKDKALLTPKIEHITDQKWEKEATEFQRTIEKYANKLA